jgi:hypothetical protein
MVCLLDAQRVVTRSPLLRLSPRYHRWTWRVEDRRYAATTAVLARRFSIVVAGDINAFTRGAAGASPAASRVMTPDYRWPSLMRRGEDGRAGRRVADERAAVSVALRRELAGGVPAEQFDACVTESGQSRDTTGVARRT